MSQIQAGAIRRTRKALGIALLLPAMLAGGVWWWNASELPLWRERITLHGDTGDNFEIAFSSDSKTLAEGSLNDEQPIVRLWDVASGRHRSDLTLDVRPLDSPSWITSLAVSPDGPMVAACCTAGSKMDSCLVAVWDIATGRRVALLDGRVLPWTPNDWQLRFRRDGRALLLEVEFDELGDRFRGLIAWDTATWHRSTYSAKCVGGMPLPAFAPDGRSFAEVTGDGSLSLREASTGRVLASLTAGVTPVARGEDSRVLRFSPDGAAIVLDYTQASPNRSLIWDIYSGRVAAMPAGFGFHQYTPDGLMMAGTVMDPGTPRLIDGFQIWSVHAGTMLVEMRRNAWPKCLGITGDAKTLAVRWQGATNSWLQRFPWPVQSFAASNLGLTPRITKEVLFHDIKSGRPRARLIERNPGVINGNFVYFAPDGKTMAALTEDGKLTLWDSPR